MSDGGQGGGAAAPRAPGGGSDGGGLPGGGYQNVYAVRTLAARNFGTNRKPAELSAASTRALVGRQLAKRESAPLTLRDDDGVARPCSIRRKVSGNYVLRGDNQFLSRPGALAAGVAGGRLIIYDDPAGNRRATVVRTVPPGVIERLSATLARLVDGVDVGGGGGGGGGQEQEEHEQEEAHEEAQAMEEDEVERDHDEQEQQQQQQQAAAPPLARGLGRWPAARADPLADLYLLYRCSV